MPVVVNPHGLESYQALGWKDRLKGVPFRWIFNSIFRSADYVVSEGGRLTGILKRILGDDGNIVTFYNGVNPPADPIERSFTGVRRFLFVGRFVRNKGLHVLFRVLEKLPPEIMQRSDFTLAGSGPLLDTYRQASKWTNVHFTGFIDDASLLRLYEDSHVFLLPTLFEGMPTVVLEAMGKSMPVIVSDVGGTSVMVNRENGFLLEAGHEQQLLDALTAMTVADPETLQQLGSVSFRRVWENHSWTAIAQQHISFFCSLGLVRKP
jgi:glycosyltransferase involved in cell wall biosynthesis